MDAGTTWERLLHTPTTWIVVAAVLFVVAVVLLVAGARAARRAARAQREEAAAAAAARPAPADEDPVTEPSVPRRAPAAPAGPVTEDDADDEPVTEPSVARASEPDAAVRRLLGALVDDPSSALAGVAALERGEEPGRAAVTLLRSGVPAPAVARLCGVEPDDLGDLVAATLGILPEADRSVVAEPAVAERVSL